MRLPEYAPFLVIAPADSNPYGLMVWLDVEPHGVGRNAEDPWPRLMVSIDDLSGRPPATVLAIATRAATESVTVTRLVDMERFGVGDHDPANIEDDFELEFEEEVPNDGVNLWGIDDIDFHHQRWGPELELGDVGDDLRRVLPFVLYLCSDDADIVHGGGSVDELPVFAKPTKTRRHGARIFPPPAPTYWGVGWRLGRAVRRSQQSDPVADQGSDPGSGNRLRPHLRRAHWHLYWTGKGSRLDPTRREARIRWVPPTLVAARTPDDLVSVAHEPFGSIRRPLTP